MVTANTQPICYLVSPLPYGSLPGQENEEAKEFAQKIILPALETEGFRVLTAEDGFRHFAGQQRNPATAIASSQEWLERSDLVIVDMTQEADNCVFEIGYRNALKKPCIVYTAGRKTTTGEIAGVRYLARLSRDISTDTKIQHLREQIRQVMTGVPPAASALDQPNFGFASDSAPFGSGTFADSSGEASHDVPAAGRYVKVTDNQPAFDEIRRSLTVIKNEFAADHNKQELPIENIEGALAEINAFELMMDKGWVSTSAARGFLDALKYIKTVCVDASAIVVAAGTAIGALIKIFGLL